MGSNKEGEWREEEKDYLAMGESRVEGMDKRASVKRLGSPSDDPTSFVDGKEGTCDEIQG
jgi:hypothetical protein